MPSENEDFPTLVKSLDKLAGELSWIRKLFLRYMEIKEYEHNRDVKIDANHWQWKGAGEHIDHE